MKEREDESQHQGKGTAGHTWKMRFLNAFSSCIDSVARTRAESFENDTQSLSLFLPVLSSSQPHSLAEGHPFPDTQAPSSFPLPPPSSLGAQCPLSHHVVCFCHLGFFHFFFYLDFLAILPEFTTAFPENHSFLSQTSLSLFILISPHALRNPHLLS